MTRRLDLVCDGCGATITTDGRWPDGWYLWQGRDWCHACAVPRIIAALERCEDDPPHRPDLRWQ